MKHQQEREMKKQTDKKRLDWLNNNFFNRENLDWNGKVSKSSWMWVFFAPINVQSDVRDVIDAAMKRDEE